MTKKRRSQRGRSCHKESGNTLTQFEVPKADPGRAVAVQVVTGKSDLAKKAPIPNGPNASSTCEPVLEILQFCLLAT